MLKHARLLGCLCALAFIVASRPAHAATGTAVDAETDNRAVRLWLETYSACMNKSDIAAFGGLWAEGADWAPPDAPMVSGRTAILALARATFEKYAVSHSFTAQAIRLVDGFGVAIVGASERYTPKVGSAAAWEQHVKGVIILRRSDDGSWTATHFIWNRDARPTP
jgi:uncharacterized protein (TIGR02246 family)